MAPTEQEIKFFTSEEAKRIQELWEPKLGDWVRLAPHDLYDFEDGIIVLPADNAEDIVVVRTDDHQHLLLYPSELIWLPRQGQLQVMLEERGWSYCHYGNVPTELKQADGTREVGLHSVGIWRRDVPIELGQPLYDFEAIGPTPSIALGRALIEVLKEE